MEQTNKTDWIDLVIHNSDKGFTDFALAGVTEKNLTLKNGRLLSLRKKNSQKDTSKPFG